jgi:head-tail adaptor
MPKKIYPSEFRRRVTFKQAIPIVDDGGGVSTSEYEELYTTWAKVEDLSTNQKVYYGLDAFKDTKRVTVRFTDGRNITTAMIMDYINGDNTIPYQIISQQMYTQDYKRYQELIVQGFDVDATK